MELTPEAMRVAIARQRVQKKEIARRCGVHPSLVSLWLNGTRRVLPEYEPVLRDILDLEVG